MVRVKKEDKNKKAEVKKTVKKDGLTIDVFDTKGEVVEKMELPKEIFGKEKNDALISQVVRVYLANQRKGTASTKTRGEVKGSSRKIYKQKGTGRARHGTIRAPIFVHGGVVFGPKPRDYSLKFPKKMRKIALFTVLSAKFGDGEIKVVTGLDKLEKKTKEMVNVMKNLKLHDDGKKVLLVLPNKADTIYKAVRNIESVRVAKPNNINTYEILNSKTLLFTKDSIEELSKHFLKGE